MIGDLDADADPDLVVLSASTSAAGLIVLLNDGQGGITPGWSTPLLPLLFDASTDLELGDLDADGDLDLVVNLPFADATSRLNAGDGTFDFVQPIGLAGQRVQNELGHLDGDAFLDNAYYELDIIGYVGSSQGHGDGTFSYGPETHGMAGDSFARTALGDLTGDGLEDLVVASQSGLELVPGAPGTVIQSWSGAITKLNAGDYDDAAIADLDGDGGLDLVATKPGTNAVAVWLGPPAGPPTFYPAGLKPLAVCVADLNADTVPDVVVTSGRSGTVEILLGGGGGALLAPVSVPTARQPLDVAAADLDADGDVDLAVTDTKLGGRVVLLFNKLIL